MVLIAVEMLRINKAFDNLLSEDDVTDVVRQALQEDVGGRDITSEAIVADDCPISAAVVSRGDYVVSGTGVGGMVFRESDRKCDVNILVPDGSRIRPGRQIMIVKGGARGVLRAERTALNFMQRMTGIATLTNLFIQKVKPYNVKILDTRKTAPMLRKLDKYAVRCGGGSNHRMGLYDMALIKDNHRRIWVKQNGASLAQAVAAVRRRFPDMPLEIEVETESELNDVLRSDPDWILLDNMTPDQLRRCVGICAGKCRVEASGGITLENVEEIAAAGVNAISLGCLTHSVQAADLALEVAV